MNNLNDFYLLVENILDKDKNIHLQLKTLRDLVKESLANNLFKLDCISHIIHSIERCQQTNEVWNAPHFYYHDRLKFSVRIVYWPAFYDNNPHKHKTWSVTGVFHNKLNIYTYNYLENPPRLAKERFIIANEGDAGYLMPGCIHNVSNYSHELSASFHLFNNIDVTNPKENAIWYPSPKRYNLLTGLTERALSICLKELNDIESANSYSLIYKIYNLGSIHLKLNALQAMYKYNPDQVQTCFEKLKEHF